MLLVLQGQYHFELVLRPGDIKPFLVYTVVGALYLTQPENQATTQLATVSSFSVFAGAGKKEVNLWHERRITAEVPSIIPYHTLLGSTVPAYDTVPHTQGAQKYSAGI